MFSIIVPSYNRNSEVNALLASLENQTVKNFEVIVVDDCSPNAIKIDRTFTFPVKLVRNECNAGPAKSRNVGAEHAQHDWLLFLDDDDRFDDRKCEILAERIAENPMANFVYHPAKCEMVNEGFSYVTKPFPPHALTLENMLLANKIGGMPMMGIKKTLFFQLGGLSTNLKSLEDYDFVLKLVSCADLNALYVDEPLSLCAFHTKRSSVSTNTENTENAIEAIRRQYVKTPQQSHNFKLNSLYMLAYPNAMNLSRKAAGYYFAMFKLSYSLKHLIIAAVTFISPKLAINLKRFV
ncbi:glycosyltransferase [Actinobacillus succinogenes]|uniref:Glycosyl transferase family 2 n=1 Tax=Actinobacillus succinogenes (strain ATCC 55618 / DSM 22257 / CCUG 43843 / 130Z) TaxID=339671 RepID=A6VNZ8_ACTSZ|nr:glycosyltransferase family 2 protein [Actinobacillus succinogenes]ABR74695.1 glycosyl transferase family 2 [Actinobacillus succinogenes 130Z]PHI40884.1 glycosyltransferase [Actinobacillus succinogenes]